MRLGTEIIRQSGIIGDVCQDNSPENLSRKENIEELSERYERLLCTAAWRRAINNITLSDFLIGSFFADRSGFGQRRGR